MAAESSGRRIAPIKTYSRRVNIKVEVPSSKKRAIEEVSTVESSPLVKKFKRSSIQSYFKPIQNSSSPVSTSSLHSFSDTLAPTSTPPSSPPSRTGSPFQYKSLQRPRRRLQTRPNLAPIAKMSERSYDGDDATTLAEIVGSMEDDSRVKLAGDYLDREERRDYERSRATSMPQINHGRNNSRHQGTHPRHSGTKECSTRSDCRSRASTETLIDSASLNQMQTCLELADYLAIENGGVHGGNVARHNFTTGGPSARVVPDNLSNIELPPLSPLPEGSGGANSFLFHDNSAFSWLAPLYRPKDAVPLISDVPSQPIDILVKPKKKTTKGGYQQQLIDLSIERLQECSECGMPYDVTSKKDMKLHDKFHRDVVKGRQPKKNTPKVDVWSDCFDGVQHQVRVLTRSASAKWRFYFEQALELSYQDMGGLKIDNPHLWSEITNPQDEHDPNKVPRYKVYVYLVGLETVGVLVAERIARGGRYYHGPVTHDQFGKAHFDFIEDKEATQEYVSKDISYEVFMSVDRIWTHRNYRRKNIATLLVDRARDDFIPGLVLSKRRIAFSLPTGLGKKFAEKYCKDVFQDAPFLVNLDDATSIVEDDMLCHIEPRLDVALPKQSETETLD